MRTRSNAPASAAKPRRQVVSLVVLSCALIASFASPTKVLGEPPSLVVGGKDFTEQLLMAEMTSQLLASKGFKVETRSGYDTARMRKAQEEGRVDLYWEYTGTSLREFNKVAERLGPAESLGRVKQLDAEKGLVWLQPSHVNNTYGLAMRRAEAVERRIATITELAAAVQGGEQLSLATGPEFYERSDGLGPLQQAYGFEFGRGRIVRLDADQIYALLRDVDLIQVGMVFATDGRLSAYDLLVLEDDKEFFPNYIMAPVVRKESLERHPALAGYLSSLATLLDNRTMAELNGEVDVKATDVREVARQFLKRHNLI